ncbi:phage terminase large subunit family protein [bacterium]|nr:phage terminase large subunit family protein [bacterium]
METWGDIELVMRTPYMDVFERAHAIRICAVDSGYLTDEVYEFCAMNSDICIPIKGSSNPMATQYTVTNVDKDVNGKPIATGLKLYKLDTGYYKDILDSKIKRSINAIANDETAQNNLLSFHSGTNALYVKQYTSEYKHVETNPRTLVEKREWRKVTEKADNHLWDCGTYITFLGEMLGIRFLPSEPIDTVPRRREHRTPRHDDDESNY